MVETTRPPKRASPPEPLEFNEPCAGLAYLNVPRYELGVAYV
jgi:hypothetical protein